MRTLYAISLAVGVLALVAWILVSAFAQVNERPQLDPDNRFGVMGRRVVAGITAFGLAGTSASYGGWPTGAAVGAAVAAAIGMAWYAGRIETKET